MRRKIEADKWKHFWVGIPLGVVLQLVCFYYFTNAFTAISAASALLVFICYGFELFSLVTKMGHHDLLDAIAGIIGGAIGLLVVVALKMLDVIRP